jgi:hypothetical protein
MYQNVLLVDLSNGGYTYKTVKARLRGRAVVRSDGEEVVHYTILWEGEDGMYYTQEIICFPYPFRAFFFSSSFESFEDAFLTLSAFNNALKRSDFDE